MAEKRCCNWPFKRYKGTKCINCGGIFVFRYYEDDHFEWVEMTEEEA